MLAPRTIPLTAFQQRDVAGWIKQREVIQSALDLTARAIIAGADLDPNALHGWAIDMSNPAVGVVLTPPAGFVETQAAPLPPASATPKVGKKRTKSTKAGAANGS